MTTTGFIFVVCQKGAESVCKSELVMNYPEFKLAYSRPGFVTFKVEESVLPEKFHLKSTFARTFGWCLGKHTSSDLDQLVEKLGESGKLKLASHLHIFERDKELPGSRDFEPGISVLARQVGDELAARLKLQFEVEPVINRHATADDFVYDIVLVEPDEWWFGYHYATSKPQRWPGGAPRLKIDGPLISRAYLKLAEALRWSGIRVNEGDHCTEIGASPGGACQLLLEKGANVIAIDPAELEKEISDHQNLKYIRARGREVRKKELSQTKWLFADLNVAPNYTLDTIEDIASSQHLKKLQGMILTLKLSDWDLATQIPAWIDRVGKMGFQVVKTRQLAFNRKEICLIAIRDRYALRATRKRN